VVEYIPLIIQCDAIQHSVNNNNVSAGGGGSSKVNHDKSI